MKLSLNLYIYCVCEGRMVAICAVVCWCVCEVVDASKSHLGSLTKHFGQQLCSYIFTFPLNPPLAKGDLVKEQSTLMGGSV